MSPPKVGLELSKLPELDVSPPKVGLELSKLPELDVSPRKVGLELSKLPELDVSPPKVGLELSKLPELDVSPQKVGLELVKLPELDVSQPKVGLQLIKLPQPCISIQVGFSSVPSSIELSYMATSLTHKCFHGDIRICPWRQCVSLLLEGFSILAYTDFLSSYSVKEKPKIN